jgi:hypothetical protein
MRKRLGNIIEFFGDLIELVFDISDTVEGAKKTANKKAKIRKIKK